MIEKRYLGDGVYVEIERGMLKLTTQRDDSEHFIYLEPEVMQELIRFWNDARRQPTTEETV